MEKNFSIYYPINVLAKKTSNVTAKMQNVHKISIQIFDSSNQKLLSQPFVHYFTSAKFY